jgi:uncharacterized membrane protein
MTTVVSSSWRSQLLSFVERATPRALSAVVLLLLAFVASPAVVGVYSAGILVYTAYQAVSDGAMRQVIVVVLQAGPSGVGFMRKYQMRSALMGFGVMALFIALFASYMHVAIVAILGLWPLAFAPGLRALGIEAVGRLQLAGRWKDLARGQLLASAASVVAATPLVLLLNPVFGAAAQTALAEGLFAMWCRRVVLEDASDAGFMPLVKPLAHQFTSMSVYSGLAWTQGQADRVLVGIFGGIARLGEFTTATALGRALGDAIAASTANVLRASYRDIDLDDPGAREAKANTERILRTSVLLGLAATLAGCLGAWVLHFVLPHRWQDTLDAVPVASLVCVLAPLSWSGAVLQVRRGARWTALLSPISGIALSPLIAIGAAHDIRTGAWLLVVREVVIVAVAFVVLGRAAPWRSFVLGVAITAVMIPVVLVGG